MSDIRQTSIQCHLLIFTHSNNNCLTTQSSRYTNTITYAYNNIVHIILANRVRGQGHGLPVQRVLAHCQSRTVFGVELRVPPSVSGDERVFIGTQQQRLVLESLVIPHHDVALDLQSFGVEEELANDCGQHPVHVHVVDETLSHRLHWGQ